MIHWSSQKLAHIDPKQMESSKERSEEYKEGTSTLLVHSGLDEQRWREAKARCCYSRNIQELPVDGKTHFERKYDTPIRGPIVPFGAEILYRPISTEDKNRLLHSAHKSSQAFLLDMPQNAGSGWTGDLRVAGAEELKDNTAS